MRNVSKVSLVATVASAIALFAGALFGYGLATWSARVQDTEVAEGSDR